MELAILILYGISLLFILIYTIVQFTLVIRVVASKYKTNLSTNFKWVEENMPFVTIQLPVYNEKYVVERLIDSIVKLNYPKERFEIQVLDDSTDETTQIIRNKVEEYSLQGFQMEHLHRKDRKGFKAGALQEGLLSAKGAFIAIFDADFIPNAEFLKTCLPYFENNEIGMVQTPWAHINKNYSFLTKIQAFALDAHFKIEQVGRNAGGHFINFNGTAGVWRKSCINDAGGWEFDTLTEDLDLSYRAQLKGWKFVFTQQIESPAEIPVAMSAIKNQQFRWIKGGAENLIKSAGKVLRSKSLKISTKIHGMVHLLSSSVFLFVFLTAFLSVPGLYIKHIFPEYSRLFLFAGFFIISLILLMIFYAMSYQTENKKGIYFGLSFVTKFFAFLSVSMGLSFHNTIAILEAYLGKKSSFVRTPKFNIISNNDKWKGNVYLNNHLNLISIIEVLLVGYFLFGIVSAFILKDYGLLPFHLMLLFGYLVVAVNSVFHIKSN